ncbi:arylsulfatase [Tunicatimonas pelagia]|uniref:arylsulfatase n=1 Tax=Tunicatimonas pelagia TaxID=931531 RepID=UPI002666E15F|nr:arylsulfatase [Tunicatimonas pelagia]WKN44880.1 arylsulfatase [Tunicatimonas pelagia]
MKILPYLIRPSPEATHRASCTYGIICTVVWWISCQTLAAQPADLTPEPVPSSFYQSSPAPPNIIYILADDLGYGDLSLLGQTSFATPHIDRLASQGMRFTQHYSGSAVCAPSRASLMTGLHTGHTAVRGNEHLPNIGVAPLSAEQVTLPEAIKTGTDYVTGMTGRWHLGGELSDQTPHDRGFDYHWGKLSSDFPNHVGVMIDNLWDGSGKHRPYAGYAAINTEPMYENGALYHLTDANLARCPINTDDMVTHKAKQFIADHRDQPFFLYVAYSLPHAPMEYHERHPVASDTLPATERAFVSMVLALDNYLGQLLHQLDTLGLSDNTVVIFTSDNGAHNEGGHDYRYFNSNGPFREYKRSFHEGGLHAPMIVRWPGKVPPGSTTDHVSAFWDVLPTLCDVAGAPVPEGTDGISFLPTLLGQEQPQHDYLYWEFNETVDFQKNQYKQAVRKGLWKGIYYIEQDAFELYDLSRDRGEDNNVAKQHPTVVAELRQIMQIAHEPSERFPLTKEERAQAKK